MWYVVRFVEEDTVAVVPQLWYHKDTSYCSWPPVKDASKMVKNKQIPELDWKQYKAVILGGPYGIKQFTNMN